MVEYYAPDDSLIISRSLPWCKASGLYSFSPFQLFVSDLLCDFIIIIIF